MKSSILIIEKDPEVLNTIKAMVEIAGNQAADACTTDAALTALSKRPFDVVMTSSMHASTLKMISLPWLVKQVQPAAAVVLTAAGQPVERTAAGSIDTFLTKPLSIAGIRRAIAGLPLSQPHPQLTPQTAVRMSVAAYA